MKQLKIIIPIDFTEASYTGARYALMLAETIPVELLLLHVVKPHVKNEPAYGDANVQERSIARSDLDAFRQKMLAFAHRDIPIKNIVAENQHMESALSSLVAREQADIVIMGTAGTGWLRKYLFGTHAGSVALHNPCPVLTVPEKTDIRKPQHIIYATDMMDMERELNDVIAFAKLLDAWVHVFHVFSEKKYLGKFDTKGLLEKIRNDYGYLKIKFAATAETDVVEGINKYIDDEKGDMLAVFSARKNYAERLLMDSISLEEVLRVRLPLLTFYKPGELM